MWCHSGFWSSTQFNDGVWWCNCQAGGERLKWVPVVFLSGWSDLLLVYLCSCDVSCLSGAGLYTHRGWAAVWSFLFFAEVKKILEFLSLFETLQCWRSVLAKYFNGAHVEAREDSARAPECLNRLVDVSTVPSWWITGGALDAHRSVTCQSEALFFFFFFKWL